MKMARSHRIYQKTILERSGGMRVLRRRPSEQKYETIAQEAVGSWRSTVHCRESTVKSTGAVSLPSNVTHALQKPAVTPLICTSARSALENYLKNFYSVDVGE